MDYVTVLLQEDRTIDEWRELAADMLILTYVPEADRLTRQDALELALERDLAAANSLADSAGESLTVLQLDRAAFEAAKV